MKYKVEPELKPISANLKRLDLDNYFKKRDFKIELEENDFDELWDYAKSVREKNRSYEEFGDFYKDSETFIICLDLILKGYYYSPQDDSITKDSFNFFFLVGIKYFIRNSNKDYDYTNLIESLKNNDLIYDDVINNIENLILNRRRELELNNKIFNLVTDSKKIIEKSKPQKKSTENKKYQIFISSTFIDLIEERQAAVEAILKKGHIPAGMELFTAGDKSQWDVIKKWIDESDIYLLILGGRYGSIDNETGLSYTEMEYNYALERKKPFFALSLSDDILNNKSVEIIRDFDLKNPKYISFKEKVKSKMCAFPKNIDQIKTEINHSLDNLILENKNKMQGWIKGNK